MSRRRNLSKAKKRRVPTHIEQMRKIKGKIFLIFVGFFACCILLTIRVYAIKAEKGTEYELEAMKQQVDKYEQTVPSMRGSILDRNKKKLAESNLVYNVIFDSRVIANYVNEKSSPENQEKQRKKVEYTLTLVDELLDLEALGLSHETLKDYIAIDPQTNKPNKDSNYVTIAKKIPASIADQLRTKIEDNAIVGIWLEEDSKRVYEQGILAAHVVGFIRDVKWGLERRYDTALTGVNGRAYITFDEGQIVTRKLVEAKQGYSIVTTIDRQIQKLSEEAVDMAVKEYNPKRAATIVMDPNTGEVLGMASYPSFDPNDPAKPIYLDNPEFPLFNELWESMTSEDQGVYRNQMWRNYAVSDTYEPGSIFKPFVMAAAIEEGIVSMDQTFECNGGKQVADKYIPCHKTDGHGTQTLGQLIANSCNVGMMDIAEAMKKDLFYRYQKEFGVGEYTEIDLPSEESCEHVMFGLSQIGPVELATMSFGQSFNMTPLQAINSFSSLINGGYLMRPYVVSQVIDGTGSVIKETSPQIQRKVVSKETSDILKSFLRDVVEEGTGKKAQISGYDIGGKTGTAQKGREEDKSKQKHILSYISFLPVEDPQVIAIVMIDEPEVYIDGVTSAGAATKFLLEGIIKYMNIPPTSAITDDELANAIKTDDISIKDFVGWNIVEASNDIIESGLRYQIFGKGTEVINQVPAAGTVVNKNATVIFYVQSVEGEEEVLEVPLVEALTYSQAITLLTDQGFIAVPLSEIPSDEYNSKLVTEQSPRAQTLARFGSQVTLSFE